MYISQVKCGIEKTAWVGNQYSRTPLGFYLQKIPDKLKVQRHIDRMRDIVKSHETKSQTALIQKLNPICRGLANYYAFSDNLRAFKSIDHKMVYRLLKWGYNKHPNKGKRWVKNQYFHKINNRDWYFAVVKNGKVLHSLYVHSKTGRKRYIKVKGTRSPYDGDKRYWNNRLKLGMSKSQAYLLSKQDFRCAYCQGIMTYGMVLEIDHVITKYKDGLQILSNFQMVHVSYHDRIHTSYLFKTEEPDEV
uniref:Putative group II intron maturase n=1 Tax=Neodangemannia microcystis TaxID=173495 RepID=A0A1W6EHK2_9CHLO|nr:putative group II intron maturase [Neodangemannia microcystis]ARK14815.1 putative group II intron maturase [Neodangemannia microcystis]